MKISHKIINVSGETMVYIYVTVDDIYEFGKENLGKGENSDFLTKLRNYIANNLDNAKKAAAIIIINGVVIGSLTLAALYPNQKIENLDKDNLNQVEVYKESENTKKDSVAKEEKIEEQIEIKSEQKEEVKSTTEKETNKVVTNINNKTNSSTKIATNKSTTKKENATATNKESSNKTASNKPTTVAKPTTSKTPTTTKTQSPVANTTTKPSTSTTTSSTNSSNEIVSSGPKIKFNNGGVVSEIDLEEYIIGVVAAEMPASFHSEALKAQAVVARTYAMKKASRGITLVNSTAHQVYNSTTQMKAKWGSSYSTYYNKIKNAVNATKGQVLKYNGSYIEALYFSMSNGKTELPSYVWSTNYPYLQVVSSSWDENISAAKHTITMTYATLSSKLGVTVEQNSEIKVLSKTTGDRVNQISIAGKIFTGVKVRSLLGLRSADFDITKTDTGVSITTRGFGHGVGMSQYGANGAAKAGYTYKQILSHYYSGASLVSL